MMVMNAIKVNISIAIVAMTDASQGRVILFITIRMMTIENNPIMYVFWFLFSSLAVKLLSLLIYYYITSSKSA